MKLYNLIWNEYCSWYLEMIKPQFGEKIHENTYQEAIDAFSQLYNYIAPIHAIYHGRDMAFAKKNAGEDCIISTKDRKAGQQ